MRSRRYRNILRIWGVLIICIFLSVLNVYAQEPSAKEAICATNATAIQEFTNGELYVGGINFVNGKEVDSTTRARTDYYDITQNTVTVDVGATGSKYGVFFYDESYTYLGWSNWKTTGSYEAAEGTRYVRVVIGYTDNRELDKNGLAELNRCFTVTEKGGNEEPEDSIVISMGGVNFVNGRELTSTNRARTDYYDITQNTITVDVGATGSKYGVFFYDESYTYLGWSNWKTTGSYEAAEGTRYVRVVIGYTDNRELDKNGLAELNRCFTVTEKGGNEEPEDSIVISMGGVNFVNGRELTSTNRARTDYYDITQNTITVDVGATSSKYGMFFYDENRTYLGWSNWKTTGSYEAAEGTRYVRVVIGYTDNRELDNSKIKILNHCIHVTDGAQPSFCGDSIVWSIEYDTLVLSGSGAMYNFASTDEVPWATMCSKIKHVSFEGNITSIGDYAFANMTNLEEVKLPTSVIQIGKYAFYNCSNIKGSVNGANITVIGDYSFNGCSNIETILIGENITIIGDYVFDNCENLTSLTFARDLTIIGNLTVKNCKNLKTITIADNVVSMGDSQIEMSDSESVTITNDTVYVNGTNGASATLPVFPVKVVKVTDVKLNTNEMELEVGDAATLMAIVVPSDATNQNVQWSSEDEEIVRVDSNGTLTALKAGTTTVTATTEDGGFTDSASVVVKEKEPVKYTVTYDAGEGTFADGAHTKTDSTQKGEYTLSTEVPVRSGYTFEGWSLNGEKLDAIAEISGDCTFTALWEEEPEKEPVLVFTKEPQSKSVNYGDNVTLSVEAQLELDGTFVTGDEPITYDWLKIESYGGVSVSSDAEYSFVATETAKYRVFAICGTQKIKSEYITVTVSGIPEITDPLEVTIVGDDVISALEGSEVTLTATINRDDPAATYDWYNSNFEIVGTGSSYTFTVTEETTGIYSCTVNSLGEVATSGDVEVSIEYPPSVEPEVYIWTTFTDVIFNPMDPPQQISIYCRAEIPGADSLEYHWQESSDGETWEFINNESFEYGGMELLYTVRSDGMKYYRVQVIDQNTHEHFISNVVSINVTYVS